MMLLVVPQIILEESFFSIKLSVKVLSVIFTLNIFSLIKISLFPFGPVKDNFPLSNFNFVSFVFE